MKESKRTGQYNPKKVLRVPNPDADTYASAFGNPDAGRGKNGAVLLPDADVNPSPDPGTCYGVGLQQHTCGPDHRQRESLLERVLMGNLFSGLEEKMTITNRKLNR